MPFLSTKPCPPMPAVRTSTSGRTPSQRCKKAYPVARTMDCTPVASSRAGISRSSLVTGGCPTPPRAANSFTKHIIENENLIIPLSSHIDNRPRRRHSRVRLAIVRTQNRVATVIGLWRIIISQNAIRHNRHQWLRGSNIAHHKSRTSAAHPVMANKNPRRSGGFSNPICLPVN